MSNNRNSVCWFEIYVNDMERAKKFYSTILNIEMTDAPEMEGMENMQMVFFPWIENAPNTGGALVKMSDMPPGPGGTMVYFDSEDCSIEESRIESAGGKVLQSKFQIGEHGYCTIFMDTEGNTVGLHSLK